MPTSAQAIQAVILCQLVKPITKKAISIGIDEDILDWFKSRGKNYQTMINTVLRSYVENHQK